MRRLLTLLVTLLIPMTLIPTTAAAQGRLYGTLTDPTGSLLPGVVVPASHRDDVQERTATVRTDQSGNFELTDLVAGPWSVQAMLPGFETRTRQVVLGIGEIAEWSPTLVVGSIEETITIAAGTPPQPPTRREPPPQATPPQPPSSTSRIGGSIKPPTKIQNVNPIYPSTLAAAGTEGLVQLEGVIGVDGMVRDVEVAISAHPELDRAAADALTAWEFTPTLLNGAPIDTRIKATFRFSAR